MGKSSQCHCTGHLKANRKEQGSVRALLLILAVFLLGGGLTALWFYRGHIPRAAAPSPALLSQSTLKVLDRISSPVEIRFYSILDPATIPQSLRAFSSRIDQLITAYELHGHGNIKISRYNEPSDANASAASANGIKPFNLEKGDACYLGIALNCRSQIESIPYLDPDWEPALESDLTRTLARVIETKPALSSASATKPLDPTIVNAVKQAVPNLESISVAEARRILREKALEEFRNVAKEGDGALKEAQERVKQAEAQSETDRQAAIMQLQELQSNQLEKLKAIAARNQAEIDALEQLKK